MAHLEKSCKNTRFSKLIKSKVCKFFSQSIKTQKFLSFFARHFKIKEEMLLIVIYTFEI